VSREPSRPAERTRQALIEAAVAIFAENGFARGSVRAITQAAGANQAAIAYHFGGKEGLYRAVLRTAIEAFSAGEAEAAMPQAATAREELARFFRTQLRPLVQQDAYSAYVRIFAWENVDPTPVLRDLLAAEPVPVLERASAIVARYLPPDATREEAALAALWLLQQPGLFVRDAAYLTAPPLGFTLDEGFVERLAGTLTDFADAALKTLAAPRSAG
jgi:AcrR family transcriptional regulator